MKFIRRLLFTTDIISRVRHSGSQEAMEVFTLLQTKTKSPQLQSPASAHHTLSEFKV